MIAYLNSQQNHTGCSQPLSSWRYRWDVGWGTSVSVQSMSIWSILELLITSTLSFPFKIFSSFNNQCGNCFLSPVTAGLKNTWTAHGGKPAHSGPVPCSALPTRRVNHVLPCFSFPKCNLKIMRQSFFPYYEVHGWKGMLRGTSSTRREPLQLLLYD